MQKDDPAPVFTGPDDALDRLAEWGRQSRRLARQRDPLVKAALLGPLAHHGGLLKGQETTGLTAQTMRRIKGREDIPVAPVDTSAEVDWDGYADYLATESAMIREALGALPSTADRSPTPDDLRARLLEDLSERVRNTEISDVGYWQLTMELRGEAQDAQTPTLVLQDDWDETPESEQARAQYARILNEVADQITGFRTQGEAAFQNLNPAVLERARAELAPPSSTYLLDQEAAEQPTPDTESHGDGRSDQNRRDRR
ncbi:hypothetical protein ACIQU4_28380 [Streptomyces sp. NPDC090741]|uniref:hypothetical protein n=1 Tax=Streptomyces sp. NPDC090741 TaxID=3365967 RepID=UPI00382114D6